jgi:hypothetical protein
MLFVVIRQIENLEEPKTRDYRIFVSQQQAKGYYHDAESVCWNEPASIAGDDAPVVTNCWLYVADTDDPVIAAQLALSGGATLLTECFPETPDQTS